MVAGYLHRLGISVVPYLDDWLIHHPDRQVLLLHQAQLLRRLDQVGPKQEKIQFLGIRLHLDLGVALLPESKAQDIAARARQLSSLRVLYYYQVAQLMGSLNWASGLIPLGHLYLRPLKRYFHTLGLTDRFMPPRRSDPSVLASLLQLWQDLSFLTSGIPIRPFQADFTIITDASTEGWGAHMGIPKFWVHALGPSGPPAPYQLLGTQGGRGCSTSLGPSDDRHGQLNSSFLYQQTRRDLVLHLVTSGSGAFYVVTSSEHSCPSKAHPRLSERRSRPPISSQSADIDRVESPSLNRESNFQSLGDPSSGHVCNCFKLPPSSVHVSDSRAKSPGGGCSVSGLAGEVDVHVFSISPAQQGYSETMVNTGGRSNTDSPLVAKTGMLSTPTLSLCGPSTVLSLPPRSPVTTGSEIHLGRKVIPSARMEALV